MKYIVVLTKYDINLAVEYHEIYSAKTLRRAIKIANRVNFECWKYERDIYNLQIKCPNKVIYC